MNPLLELERRINELVGHKSDNHWSDIDNTESTISDGDIIRYCMYTIFVLVILIFTLLGVML